MLFNSLTFVAFFAIVLALWYAIEPWRPRKAMLLVASYVFYAAWNPPFILILWLSTLVDWFVARWLYWAQRPSRRRLILLISLVVNLGLLGYFKYGGFVVENFGLAARALGLDFHPARPDIILPIGISFYTFETISYTIDVYLGRCKPFRSFLDYGLFLTFFPHLVAGPILRPDEIVPQFERPHRATSQAMGFGLFLVTLGLFEKVVLADSIFAPTADAVFGTHGPLGALDAWAGILAFTGQIFCDFAGYSTCAIGAAICFGISLPDNFRFPYAAIGFSDFWRRWHISLSRWLRDYLYVPLGGNRNGATRTQINLMLTMLIGGLWHGASWNFVIWGGIHGVYLLGERLVRRFVPSGRWVDTAGARTGLMALTFLLTCVTWVFFRAKELSGATSMLAAAFGAGGGPAQVPTQELIAVGVAIAGVVGVHWSMRDRSLEDWATNVSNNMLIGLWTVMAFSIALTQGGGDAFIYFQF